MAEAQEKEQEEVTIDLEALQASIEGKEPDEVVEEVEEEVIEDEFDVDAALDGEDPVDLEGKITEDEAREKAIARGWREEGVDKYGHRITAVEFLERTPFFKKQEHMRHDIDNANKKINQLIEDNKRIAQKSIEKESKLREEFKAEKDALLNQELLDTDDIARLKTLDKQIEQNDVQIEAQEEVSEENKESYRQYEAAKENFKKENEWYESNKSLTKATDDLTLEYVKDYHEQHGVLPPPEKAFKYALNQVKEDFPDLGEKPRRQTRVAGGGRRVVTQNQVVKKTINDMPEDMQAVARRVMEDADMTEEEYMKTYEQ